MGERAFALGSRVIGDGAPVFFVAEAGVNHNGDLGLALKLVDAAAECGADAVKFQTFRTDALVSRAAPKAGYQVETTGASESQRDMLARLELSLEAFARVQERCAKRGVVHGEQGAPMRHPVSSPRRATAAPGRVRAMAGGVRGGRSPLRLNDLRGHIGAPHDDR